MKLFEIILNYKDNQALILNNIREQQEKDRYLKNK